MKIGNAWTKTSDDGRTFISVALDEVILGKYPFLENCFINLWRIPAEDRKNENSPSWNVNISVKKQKEEVTEPDLF